jgi:hypothetical protein
MVTQEKYNELLQMYDQLVLERNDDRSYKDKLEQANKRIQELMEQMILLQRKMFGRKSERHLGSVNDLQGTLFELESLPEEAVAEKEQITYERRKPSVKSDHAGRNPLPEHLPVEDITMLHSKAEYSGVNPASVPDQTLPPIPEQSRPLIPE